MAFSKPLVDAITACAKGRGIELAALLAVVEVECSGNPFEADGRTPRFLFERHVFYKQLKARAPDKLQAAIDAGLAIPKWSRTTQYKDLGSAAGRARVIAAARSIDAECANRSCSWGVGQIMGFYCRDLGYGTATAMVSTLTNGGLGAQIECLVRFLEHNKLIEKLNGHQWAAFAKAYNGPAYAQNDYDTRLAEAYARWLTKLGTGDAPDEVEGIPLGRTPVQNAEPTSSPWLTPEGVSVAVSAGTGAVTAGTGAGSGPIGYALAAVIVIAALVGAYFFIQRMRRSPI
jgi:hypothetical protein